MQPRVLFHLRLSVLGAVAAIAFAVGALLLTTFPIASGVDVEPPSRQLDAVFFGLLALKALMIGAFAVVLTSLYAIVTDVLQNHPNGSVLREAGLAPHVRNFILGHLPACTGLHRHGCC